MLRVMPVFGTRPEAIKMAPLVEKLKESEDIDCVVCVTAQHREMLDQVLSKFGIAPQHDLNLMRDLQTLASLTARAIESLTEVVNSEKPDLVLVHGDTTTSFCAALAAFYAKVPVGHVEAGLRSFDKYSPFPEEMNRTMTARIADLHFAPTNVNRQNLVREGVNGQIFVTGNTVIDALQKMVSDTYIFENKKLNSILSSGKHVILLTAHRRENLGEPLKAICRAIEHIVAEHKDIEVIYPVHPNPAVRNAVYQLLNKVPRVHLVEPLEVQDMHNLINRSYLVMTDSGGLQEEAPALGKPVVILRKETERPEICEAKKAVLGGTDERHIIKCVNQILDLPAVYQSMCNASNPYGDGKASLRIIQAIRFWTGMSKQRPIDFDSRIS